MKGFSLLNTEFTISFVDDIETVGAQLWQKLNTSSCPLLDYSFFNSLEKSKSVHVEQGWKPHHLVVDSSDETIGVMPLYLKNHSWGEYVFDWDWAEVYKRYDLDYYPKLVATIPFTPVCSDKLFSSKLAINHLFQPLIEYCEHANINSWHILFCEELTCNLPEDVYHRNTVQFHWFNRNYASFEDFLSTFSARKRKNTRKERQSIEQQGIKIRRLKNSEISEKDIEFFYLAYQLTYLKRGHQPHLSLAFFQQLLSNDSVNALLIVASNDKEDIACSLFFYDDKQLYGRYWGCIEFVKNLHFELCYYQGIEFCIEQKLEKFNPGTQGEHKISRGFEPVLTHSYHWIKHPSFKQPIKEFCQQEQKHMQIYQGQCRQLLPFKQQKSTTVENNDE